MSSEVTVIVVRLADGENGSGAEVTLRPDGSAKALMHGVKAGGHVISGTVTVQADGIARAMGDLYFTHGPVQWSAEIQERVLEAGIEQVARARRLVERALQEHMRLAGSAIREAAEREIDDARSETR
jgi:hypothetical protein